MVEKNVSQNLLVQLRENPEQFESFAAENAKQLTSPSILLKGGVGDIGMKLLPPQEVYKYLLLHPVVPRGLDIKANRMVSRGFRIEEFDDSEEAKEAASRMRDLIMTSGGESWLTSYIKDAYGFGNGYSTLLEDEDSGEVVHISKEHPVFFRIAREKLKNSKSPTYVSNTSDFTNDYGKMKVDPVSRHPTHYTQVSFAKMDKSKVEPIGKEISASRVAHLAFDTWGDEAEGIGLVQYVHNILRYIMNIEEAGSEAIYRSGFTQKAVESNVKTMKDLEELAKNLEGINSSDSIILPEGVTVSNLQPGQSQFEEFHDVLLTLIAIRLGVPKPILTLDGTDTNRSTMRELMRDLIYDIHADEMKVKRVIEDQIFKPACKSVFGNKFEKFPVFVFNDFEESKEEQAEVLDKTSQSVKRFTESAKILMEVGMDDQARELLGYMRDNIPTGRLFDERDNRQEVSEKVSSEDSEQN